MKVSTLGNTFSGRGEKLVVHVRAFGGIEMAIRWIIGLLAVAAFVVGLVLQILVLTIVGLVGLLLAVVVRSGHNPLAESYRDIRDPRGMP